MYFKWTVTSTTDVYYIFFLFPSFIVFNSILSLIYFVTIILYNFIVKRLRPCLVGGAVQNVSQLVDQDDAKIDDFLWCEFIFVFPEFDGWYGIEVMVFGHTNKGKLRQAQLVLGLVMVYHPDPLSLAIPPWVGAVNTGDGFGHC